MVEVLEYQWEIKMAMYILIFPEWLSRGQISIKMAATWKIWVSLLDAHLQGHILSFYVQACG